MTPPKNEWEETRWEDKLRHLLILSNADLGHANQATIETFVRAEKESSDAETLKKVLEVVERYREDLRFIWRWVDRLHGGKPHDKPEENWRIYVQCLTNYPNAPHQTGDWYEDDFTLSDLTDKLTRLTKE